MLEIKKASARYPTQLGWLQSRHSFSFGHHYDPANLGHGALRVINEDWIDAESGFPTHPHREMEILTYVLAGALEHRDSEGNRAEIRPGRTQLMHAGTGIAHSEFNREHEPVHLLQIWIEPDRTGTKPGYEMLDFTLEPGSPTVLASPNATLGGLPIRQDAVISALELEAGQSYAWPLAGGRRGWVQVARGAGRVDSVEFESGDGVVLSEVEGQPQIEATEATELLLFDLP